MMPVKINIDLIIVVSLLLQFGGFIGLVFCIRAIILAISSKNWSITEGKILQSNLYKADFDDVDYSYKPNVSYSYIINGIEYRSNRIYFGSNILTTLKKRKSIKLVNKYYVGKSVNVSFNPKNEKISVLETGVKSELINGLVVGMFFFALGLFTYLRPEFFWNLDK